MSNREIQRLPADILEAIREVSSATASAILSQLGIRDAFLQGPVPRVAGAKAVGPAVTLQFMPKREDLVGDQLQEYGERSSALWQVLEHIQAGDMLVVDARADMRTGCLGEMLITYFNSRGGAGIVVDGCIRDFPHAKEIGVPLWTRGTTPNFASQTNLYPWDFNIPVACAGVLVIPGDIIIADDDGAVVVPSKMAHEVLDKALEHQEWEVFSKTRLEEGGELSKYYPLSDEGRREYEEWYSRQPRS